MTVADVAFGNREPVRLLSPAPIIRRGRPPEIGERDREPADGALDDEIGRILDGELRLERRGDAPGEEVLLGFRRQRGERLEPFGRRQRRFSDSVPS